MIVNQKHNKNLWTQNQKQKDSVLGFDPEEIFYEISSSLCDFQNHKYHLKQVRYVQNSTKCQYDKKSSKSYLRCDPKRDSLCPHLISDVSVNTKLVLEVLSLILSDCLIALFLTSFHTKATQSALDFWILISAQNKFRCNALIPLNFEEFVGSHKTSPCAAGSPEIGRAAQCTRIFRFKLPNSFAMIHIDCWTN